MTKRILQLSLLNTLAAGMIWAGCVSNCRDDYDSAVQHCKLMYDAPDDVDDLKRCFDRAKDDYQDCIQNCKD